MLQITIPACEQWDERKQEFVYGPKQVLQLEHSLVSLSKWESKWCKAFLGKQEKTNEEVLDYIRCMTITQNVDPSVYKRLTKENIDQVVAYIDAPMTATTFYDDKRKTTGRSSETVTSELIYYWMIMSNIPFECKTWHLNRLITLIKVCSIKNTPPKKMSKREIMSRNAAINAARRKQFNTSG